ncbi:DUF11 domain-containing protein [Microbacterium sp. Leaf159]|uniref:DUF7927 domain-containing protein n=1 Tax=Microbacterium sp. Leaf159 TaxID=1736279 RepID=UPI0006F75A34|nr:DUF11 domain-containing protein [Microbacterium sp. Leaf159]KQR40166.1 hypothetical protein ASF80_12750 [Microbacterium sp. Leaf159]
MPVERRPRHRIAVVLSLAAVLGAALFGGGVAPASAASPSPVTAVSVAPYEAANPLVPSAALPFLAVTVEFERELAAAGETFDVRTPAGTRAVLTSDATVTDAVGGAPLVDVTVAESGATGDLVRGTFTPAAADAVSVAGSFTFFLQVVGSGVLDAAGGVYSTEFESDGAVFRTDVPYGTAIDLYERTGGHWVSGATATSPARFVVQAKAIGDEAAAESGGQWVAAGTEEVPPFGASVADCAATTLRVFDDDPGPVNVPVEGGTPLTEGVDYTVNCDDTLDGQPIVSATIPAPVEGAFYVLSSARDATGESTWFPVDNTAIPEVARQVALYSAVGAVSDASRDPSHPTQKSTLLLYTGRTAGTAVTVAAAPALALVASAEPDSGAEVHPGDRIRYEMTLTNTGNVPLTDATLTADLASLLRSAGIDGAFEASVGQARLEGSVLRWVGALVPGEAVTVSFTALVRVGGSVIDVDVSAESPGARGGAVATAPQSFEHEVIADATPESATPTDPSRGALAVTGADSSGAAALGGMLVLAGAAVSIVAAVRRRTASRS